MESSEPKTYVWCTYRDWSFKILEGIQDVDGWKTGLVVTTPNCIYDFSSLEKRGIPILRVDPKKDLKEGGEAYRRILGVRPDTIFHYGWSWKVPREILDVCPNVTLHPGKLPKDRGGSPIQNQILNGEEWTYANVLKLEDELDGGPVYLSERISLEGDADDVWARMTATGATLTREYLARLASRTAKPTPQTGDPTFYRRVKPEQAKIDLKAGLTARQIYNIVRAHNETDPNTYLKPAHLDVGPNRLIIERASLDDKVAASHVLALGPSSKIDSPELHEICRNVANGDSSLMVRDSYGEKVYFTRFHVAPKVDHE